MNLQLLSLTGADDRVLPQVLHKLSKRFNFVEWALLYSLEKEGKPRNPTAAWRESLLQYKGINVAAHLCGQAVFKEILDEVTRGKRIADLTRYGRVQLNINARNCDFTDAEVLTVYRVLHQAGLTLILQRHEGSQCVIDTFIEELDSDGYAKVDVLFDGSKGKGVRPTDWPSPLMFGEAPVFCGYAGGLGPDVLPDEFSRIMAAAGDGPFWIDMESGVRTGNEFDLYKVHNVLEYCAGKL